MTPQGSQLVDTSYIDNLIARVGQINVCADLQALTTEAFASLQAHISATEAQVTALLPIKALLSLPTDIGSVVTWIENLVTAQIAPQYQAVVRYEAQLAALVSKIAELTSAVEAAASKITGCAASAPALVVATLPTA